MINPLLQRHLWTDFSLHKLLMVPALFGSVFALGALTVAATSADLWGFLANIGLTLFGVIVLVAGTWRAGRTIPDQKTNRTWENIRLSSLSSWQLACGELFGATSSYWYGGVICLLMVLISIAVSPATAKNIGNISIFVFLAALLTQVSALQLSLSGMGTAEHNKPVSFMACFIFSFIAPLFIRQLLDWNTATMMSKIHISQLPDVLLATWYGLPISNTSAIILSYVLMLIWGFIGLNQTMRRELQMSTPIIVWIGFVIFCLIYFAGFTFNPNTFDPNDTKNSAYSYAPWPLSIMMWFFNESFSSFSFLKEQSGALLPLAFAFCLCLCLTYFMAFWEPKDITGLRRFKAALTQKNWRHINSLYPRWLATAQISIIVGLIFLTASLRTSTHSSFTLWVGAMLLFLCRDLGIILLLSLQHRLGRRSFLAFAYLFALYVLFPGLLAATNGSDWVFIFLPGKAGSWPTAILPPLIQATMVWILVSRKWRLHAEINLARRPQSSQNLSA